jgi:zinc protease
MLFQKLLSAFFICFLLLSSPDQAFSETLKIDFPVEKFQLKNGLTVLLAPDSSVPLISYHTWYKVGSRNESVGTTGAAHMLEHMMFKGAKKYSGKDFDRILHENGITNNAFTTWDYTGFYQNLPSAKLELMMDMEVDRMRYLSLNPQDLKSELQVVGEERRWRVDNNPFGLLQEALFGEMYKVHPYRWPVIGYMQDIQAYTSEKLKFFYDKFYVPNNAVLVISGDIDVKKTKALVEKYYSRLEARLVEKVEFPQEKPRSKPVRKEIRWDVQNVSFNIGYPGVKAGHPDSYALDVALAILGDGMSSRLHERLAYKESLVTHVGGYNMTNADPGVIFIYALLKGKVDQKKVEQIIQQEIEKMKGALVSAAELQRAKNKYLKGFVDKLQTIDGKAQTLAVNEILFGDYREIYRELERIKAVTAEDIRRVMKQYFQNQQSVTATLLPKKN